MREFKIGIDKVGNLDVCRLECSGIEHGRVEKIK